MILEVLSCFFISFVTAAVVFLAYKHIVGEKIKIDYKLILIFLLGCLIITALFFSDIAIFKNIFTILFFITLFKYKSDKCILENFYYAIFLWLYGLILDMLLMLILSLFGIDKIIVNINLAYVRIAATVIESALLYLLCLLPLTKKFSNNTIKKLMKIKPSLFLEVFLIIIFIILSIMCLINLNKANLILCGFIIIILLICLIIIIIDKKYSVKRLKEVNKILIKNHEFFIKLDTDYRVLKHNLTNQLLGIKSVADTKTQKLLNELIISYNSKFIASQDINKIPKGINGIVYEKLYNFNKSEIKLAVENSVSSELLDVIKPKNFNILCEMLGILIDNALEAAYESDEKSILIDFTEEKKYLKVNVNNTFNNMIDIDNLGNINYTSKIGNRGYGLFCLFKKKEINITTRIVNNLFQAEIKIKKSI